MEEEDDDDVEEDDDETTEIGAGAGTGLTVKMYSVLGRSRSIVMFLMEQGTSTMYRYL